MSFFLICSILHSKVKVWTYVLKHDLKVALLGGLISHTDGLVMSAVECLEDVAPTDGEFICLNMFNLST